MSQLKNRSHYPISVDSVIFGYTEGELKVALIERKKEPFAGMWAIPGGFMEGNETVEETALRELKEETGISNIEVIPGYLVTINYSYYREKVLHEKQVDFFLGKVFDINIEISHEHTEFIWASYASALELITFDNARDVLISAESFLSINQLSK